MLRLSAVLSVLLATLALGATAGCGGSDEGEENPATPTEAVTEIGEIKTLLAKAVDQARSGDFEAAEETVREAGQKAIFEVGTRSVILSLMKLMTNNSSL